MREYSCINLCSDFKPLNYPEVYYHFMKFSGGELHFQLGKSDHVDKSNTLVMTTRASSSEEIMKIAIAADALKEAGFENIELFIPYLPYSRQDRVCAPGQAFSLRVFAKIINSCEFDKVVTIDPHSQVAERWINNLKSLVSFKLINNVLKDRGSKTFHIVQPDKGACERIGDVWFKSNKLRAIIKCDKIRDPETGKLSGFKVLNPEDIGGKDCVLYDDICDGGGTFLGLAEKLREAGCGKLILAVNHGIFSKGLDDICGAYDEVWTLNTIKDFGEDVPSNFYQVKIKQ